MASLFRSLLLPILVGAVGMGALCAGAAARAADEPPPNDPTARAEWLSAQAETAFADKRFADAIRLYLDAWEAAPAASILYNVAFIYDKRLGELELAIDYYDRAADSGDADDELKTKARDRIAALRVELANKVGPKDPPPKVKKKKGGGVNAGPWIVVGSGGALLAGGIAVGLIASGTERDFQAAGSAEDKRALQSDGKTQALVADLLMGAGVLAIGAGIVWLVLDGGSDEGEGSVEPVGAGWRVEPQLIPGGAALVVGGTL